MEFKKSLDKYIASEPLCTFDDWAECIIDEFTNEFYYSNEQYIQSDNFNSILNRLFKKSIEYKYAAKIAERHFNLYIKNRAIDKIHQELKDLFHRNKKDFGLKNDDEFIAEKIINIINNNSKQISTDIVKRRITIIGNVISESFEKLNNVIKR